jgi:hypothetical protein
MEIAGWQFFTCKGSLKHTLLELRALRVLLRKYLCGDDLTTKRPPGFRHTRESGYPANSAEQTWIPACAGMTSRGEHHLEENPSIFILSG